MGGIPAAARSGTPGHRLTLADVLRAGLDDYPRGLSAHHWKILNTLLCCRTARLGGHRYRCEDCGQEHFVANSCRNRHCPNCQKLAAAEWLEKQSAQVLPVAYFHVVFTLPHQLNALIAQNQALLYNLLFASATATLLQFGRTRWKAQMGVTAVLHTWGQNLGDHYHLHCIVTGGGVTFTGGQWKGTSSGYLFPVRLLSKVFRAKFRDKLKAFYSKGKLVFHGQLEALREPGAFIQFVGRASTADWVVYAKRPFPGAKAVLAYLSRYTHRIALSNGRLLSLDANAGTVTFSYKDYADQGRRKQMTLAITEFIRRFCLHILPERFVKIRHYGLLGNHRREEKLAHARALLAAQGVKPLEGPAPASEAPEPAPQKCPHCGSTNLTWLKRCEPQKSSSRNVPETDDTS